jgi:opacity protein-like surface antigen
MTTVNGFRKCGFNLNQTNDGEDATECSIAKEHWGQLRAGADLRTNGGLKIYI